MQTPGECCAGRRPSVAISVGPRRQCFACPRPSAAAVPWHTDVFAPQCVAPPAAPPTFTPHSTHTPHPTPAGRQVSSMVSALATLHKAEKRAREREEHLKQHGRDAEAVAWVEGEWALPPACRRCCSGGPSKWDSSGGAEMRATVTASLAMAPGRASDGRAACAGRGCHPWKHHVPGRSSLLRARSRAASGGAGEDVMCVMTPEGVKVREALGEPDRRVSGVPARALACGRNSPAGSLVWSSLTDSLLPLGRVPGSTLLPITTT